MKIYKPSELRQFLQEHNIVPKRGLSQNFLIDGNIIQKIISTADVKKDDVVLEIGPGPGSLTQGLLDAGAHVIAVEKDEILAKALERFKSSENKLDISCADILEFSIEETLKKHLHGGQRAKVIANLPYHLTTPIIVKLSKLRQQISLLVLMVQKEVAERLTADVNSAEYGSITVYLNFYAKSRYAFTVSKHCFYPEPKVDSAMIAVELQEPPFVSDVEAFSVMVRRAFEQRRKMLRVSLKELYPMKDITEGLVANGINPLARPETLSLENFIQLFEWLAR